MAIYLDPPLWPAHGTLWSHLVSTSSYAELHAFAQGLGLPLRGFDLDHYDLPASRYQDALALGAIPVTCNELVRLLRASGLRVPARERAAARPARRRLFLQQQWHHLGTLLAVADADRWHSLGERVLTAWSEPHRDYHDERHLRDVLLALNQLHVMGEDLHAHTLAAAWFHDVVYAASATDEAESAAFARAELEAVGIARTAVSQIAELILATTPGTTIPSDGADFAGHHQLLDADVAIFGSSPERYREYMAGVRAEFSHVPLADFQRGRAQILRAYLAKDQLYYTPAARQLWDAQAQKNVATEILELTQGTYPVQ